MRTALRRLARLRVEPAIINGPTLTLDLIASGEGQLRGELPDSAPDGQNRFYPGDVLFSKLRPYLAKSFVVDRPLQGTGEFLCMVPNTGLDARFLLYSTLSRPWLDLASMTSYGTKMPRTNWESMAEFRLRDLQIDDQRRIVDFLDDQTARIDAVINARHRQLASLDSALRSELADLVLDGADSRMPLRRLIADERLGLWGSEPGEADQDVRVLRVADFDRDYFAARPADTVRSAERNQVTPRAVQPGDVLLERSGGTQLNPVGCPAFVAEVDGATVCSNFVSRLRPAHGSADGRYLSLVLGALYWTGQQRSFSTQTTGIQNLESSRYLLTRVPERSLPAQQQLAQAGSALIDSTQSRRDDLRRANDLLTEYKQSLITAAVSGQLDVTTASGRGMPT